MFGFILKMWQMKRYTEAQVSLCVTKGYITQQESEIILSTPQV
jgi:DNA-binding transcriptional regulator of glucitol operon